MKKGAPICGGIGYLVFCKASNQVLLFLHLDKYNILSSQGKSTVCRSGDVNIKLAVAIVIYFNSTLLRTILQFYIQYTPDNSNLQGTDENGSS